MRMIIVDTMCILHLDNLKLNEKSKIFHIYTLSHFLTDHDECVYRYLCRYKIVHSLHKIHKVYVQNAAYKCLSFASD